MIRPRTLSIVLVLLLVSAPLPGCGECDEASSQAITPEELMTYVCSHILISREGKEPAAVLGEALAVLKELDAGTPFAEVARRHSDNPGSAELGGWLGFLEPESSAFGGALQALRPGTRSGPVATEEGYQIVHRHTLEEARAIERKYVIPAYGCFFPWGEDVGGGATREATEEQARKAWEKVSSGEMTLEQAAKEYGAVPPPRTDCFIANVTDHRGQKEIYAGVKDVKPGEIAPLREVPRAFAVLKRGVYFRVVLRHILVQHLDSKERRLEVTRTRADAKALAEKVLAEVLDDPSTWSDKVVRHSDELGQHVMHGGIGIVTNGDMIPAIEEAILETAPGDIVDHVVESQGGFHVLWRVN
jgi:hypothetical protein